MRRDSQDEIDMTAMVDVTFLLLIFFIIPAAFALQKSIEVPPSDDAMAAQARSVDEFEEDSMIVRIDGDNVFWVSSPSWTEERRAPSPQEMLVQLRQARRDAVEKRLTVPSRLLVLASGDATHERVVLALDAGSEMGMEDVRLATVLDDDY